MEEGEPLVLPAAPDPPQRTPDRPRRAEGRTADAGPEGDAVDLYAFVEIVGLPGWQAVEERFGGR